MKIRTEQEILLILGANTHLWTRTLILCSDKLAKVSIKLKKGHSLTCMMVSILRQVTCLIQAQIEVKVSNDFAIRTMLSRRMLSIATVINR